MYTLPRPCPCPRTIFYINHDIRQECLPPIDQVKLTYNLMRACVRACVEKSIIPFPMQNKTLDVTSTTALYYRPPPPPLSIHTMTLKARRDIFK
ncbi:hypothetical protein EYC80_001026 [Monilinia laxa]|uniref:Uncharacterized protein n=1 Tax=Monilinia laxa TaxID=61186 RepID=A0A5N6K815_MONLA|nr:hypothetical protein EYC80_001026 [Monilinia laxa]